MPRHSRYGAHSPAVTPACSRPRRKSLTSPRLISWTSLRPGEFFVSPLLLHISSVIICPHLRPHITSSRVRGPFTDMTTPVNWPPNQPTNGSEEDENEPFLSREPQADSFPLLSPPQLFSNEMICTEGAEDDEREKVDKRETFLLHFSAAASDRLRVGFLRHLARRKRKF